MNRKEKSVPLGSYKRKREFNIGLVIFAVIFIYLFVTVFMYTTRQRISIFEVRLGNISRDTTYLGVALREETVIASELYGYIYYLQSPRSRVRFGSQLYAISPTQLQLEIAPADEPEELPYDARTDYQNLVLRSQHFNENFSLQRFSMIYSFRDEILYVPPEEVARRKIAEIDAIYTASYGLAEIVPASRDGILVLRIDGMENVTKDNFTAEIFDRANYEFTSLQDEMRIEAGNPVYKVVTSERWGIVIHIDHDMASYLGSMSWVNIRIELDQETLWAVPTIIRHGNQYFAYLSLDSAMVRYAEERFLNIELLLDEPQGLKIPRSAVIDKEFFLVPSRFLSVNEVGGLTVYVQDGETIIPRTVIPYRVTADGYYYLDSLLFERGSHLVDLETGATFTLRGSSSLQGVFNINRGYAVFRPITILSENHEYFIVREGDPHGLVNFDRIVRDGRSVRELEVVF